MYFSRIILIFKSLIYYFLRAFNLSVRDITVRRATLPVDLRAKSIAGVGFVDDVTFDTLDTLGFVD